MPCNIVLKTQAKATSEQKRLEGQAMADAELAKGTADAEVIRLRGLAEAEAKEKLAEAFQKFGEAAVLDIIVKCCLIWLLNCEAAGIY